MKRIHIKGKKTRVNPEIIANIQKHLMEIISEQSNKRHIVDGKKGFASLPNEVHLNNRLGVRVTDAEKQSIEANSEALGISMGEYIRAAIKLLSRYEVVES